MSQKLDCAIRSLLTLFCAASLVACGGGGSSATPGNPGGVIGGGSGTNGGSGTDTSGTNTGAGVTLVGLEISPGASALVLSIDTHVQLHATERYSDDSTRDRTENVTWTSSDPSVVSVSAVAGSRGAAIAHAAGTATVTAVDDTSGKTASVTVVVTEAVIQTLTITPATRATPAGYGVQYTATATYTDGGDSDVTDLVTWSSSNEAVATISNDPIDRGLATGVAAGQVTITATMPEGTAATASLTVSAAVLQSIVVSAPSATLPKGIPVQLTATATFSDSTTQDITRFVQWSSSNGAVATVSNSEGSAGVVTGSQVGTVTISASNGSITAQTSLEITGATVQSMVVTASPSRPWTWRGTSTRFFVQGTFSDGLVLDVSRDVTWSVSPGGFASFNTSAGKQNVAWALNATSSPVIITAVDPASGTSASFTWSRIRARTH